MSSPAPALPLRLAWRSGRCGACREWWPGDVESGVTIDQFAWLSGGTLQSRRAGSAEATWIDAAWQSTPQPARVRVIVSAEAVTISVPPVWRASVHLAWRDERLFVCSDLRTLADAVSETRPSPSGVGSFLAHGRSGRGLVPSLYRDIWTLQPGYRLTVRDGQQMDCMREWRPEADDQHDRETFGGATTLVRRHLDEIVDTILASHDRIGCLFSGGLDSSVVAATLLRRAPERIVLFNLGSGFGTTVEASLRARFLGEFATLSHSVDLSRDASLIRSLRATNAVAPLPVGSIFSHVFEEIISVARHHGCDAIATGDGGDEVFAERDEVLVDLLARRKRGLVAAAAHFALRNDERITRPLSRAYRLRNALQQGGAILSGIGPERLLLGAALAEEVDGATARADDLTRNLWQEGWTLSGLGSWRRAASVPEWEPVSSSAPDFSVLSPLADERMVDAVLKLRREDFVPLGLGAHTKRLLRHSALAWLPADIAMHPKIGSADGELLRRMRSEEHGALLDLLGSETARRIGLRLPAAAEDPDAPLWRSDRWVRAAALVAWFERQAPTPTGERGAANVTRVGASRPVKPAPARAQAPRSMAHVGVVAVLNVAAQLVPHPYPSPKQRHSSGIRAAARDVEALRIALVDLAQRACQLPLVTGSSFAMHRALSWYLRLLGLPAALVQGARQGQTNRRYWIDVGGTIIDVNGSEVPLMPCADDSADSSLLPISSP